MSTQVAEEIQFKPSVFERPWLALGASALSGLLLVASMPGFDVPLIGWVALVPLLLALSEIPAAQAFRTALPFGLVFSIGVHHWYPAIFPPALGMVLIAAVGVYYAALIRWGVWLKHRLPSTLAWLALPVTWAAVEFLKYITPVVADWWFVLLAASQWRSPAALQVLPLTGVFGLGFLVMLVNQTIANALRAGANGAWRSLAARALLVFGIAATLWANAPGQAPNPAGFRIGVITDMVNQDPSVLAQGEFAGTMVTSDKVSEAIFAVDATLAREAAVHQPAFIVLPENEFADADNPHFRARLAELARETGAYVIADMLWQAPTGLHDTAVMVDPSGREVLRRAKINVTDGETEAGIVAGPASFSVVQTPFGNASVAVCWDVHRLWILRELARAGARIVLLPMDNDFDGVPGFPPFHAADAVFRAAENRITIALGTVNGLSMVIDPFGRIKTEGQINARGWNVGETFVANGTTPYTRHGDWFGWLMVVTLGSLIVVAASQRRRHVGTGYVRP
ncbi:MAG: nitrilase-related carbon-nitrogen hydrolase [Burkholderiaceae bacterium]